MNRRIIMTKNRVEYNRKWYAAHKDQVNKRQRAWRVSHPDFRRKWRAANPEKLAAHNAITKAIERYGLIPPTICEHVDHSIPCLGRIEAHHYLGYASEHRLDVQWLCVRHHRIADMEINNEPATHGRKSDPLPLVSEDGAAAHD